MPITILQLIILGLIQGAAELLPVSSSAHVIVAEKLMGIDPTTPEATFLLIMLHTGTMFAVLAYFWQSWRLNYFSSAERFWSVAKLVIVATVLTGVITAGLMTVIKKILHVEVEELFGRLPLIAAALAVGGVLILVAGWKRKDSPGEADITLSSASGMGAVQGLLLPFRGFSRSGGTISTGLLLGAGRRRAEEFSFALAVILTPPVIAREALRLLKLHAGETEPHHLTHLIGPGVIGLLCSFIAGLLALRWLSRWLESGRWHYFGIYCLAAAAIVFALAAAGF
jgi:undecaprenyl-diphosphatase